jgi:hypothetical protein
VLAIEGEVLTNVTAVAASGHSGAALRSDGTVYGCNSWGGNGMVMTEDGEVLTNVVRIGVDGGGFWAVRLDDSIATWSASGQPAALLAGVSNTVASRWGGGGTELSLTRDGRIIYNLDADQFGFGGLPTAAAIAEPHLLTVAGQPLSNVVALSGDALSFRMFGRGPLVLTKGGRVLGLTLHLMDIDPQTGYPKPRDEWFSATPVEVGRQVLSNVVAITSGNLHNIALKADGTVLGWGGMPGAPYTGLEPESLPPTLTNVAAVTAGGDHWLALKRDGAVTAWGANYQGQTDVPAGLSNVVAIAAGDQFSLAVTTGPIPPSVPLPAYGRLGEMTAEADLVFKGEALSSTRVTNKAFRIQQMDPHATRFKVISVLKGEDHPGIVVFQHYTTRPGVWGGPPEPPHYRFQPGQRYLVFAARTDKPDRYYSPEPGRAWNPQEIRQFVGSPLRDDEGVIRTLDARPLTGLSIKEAHWLELNLLVTNDAPTNALYAIRLLDLMSTNCEHPWGHSPDFKRPAVLDVLRPLISHTNDEVAIAALGCFQLGSACAAYVAPHADAIAAVATTASSTLRRVAAIAALSGTGFPSLTNSLFKWLRDPAEEVRAQAVLLLGDFPGELAEGLLQQKASDPSAQVRAAVADVIGNGKMEHLLPTLVKLLADPAHCARLTSPLTFANLEMCVQVWCTNVGDVHTSAGQALLKFDLAQVADILKTNLSDAAFRPDYLCKLAEKDAAPWLSDLAEVMESRRNRIEKEVEASGVQPQASYLRSQMYLSGTYNNCWNIIYNQLRNTPAEAFAGGKLDRYLDVLENAGDTGSQEPVELYELYRMKSLTQRAARFRRESEKRYAVYGISQFFDKADAKYPAPSPQPKR